MIILKINDRVKFGSGGKLTGTIFGHGTMMGVGSGCTMLTYAVYLDEEFHGYIGGDGPSAAGPFISTLLVCADGVTKI